MGTLSLRTLTIADLDAADTITRSAYNIQKSRKNTLKRYLQIQPDGWILALLDAEPVGMVGATNYSSFAQIGLMGVLPTAQRQGVGQALMEQLLVWLDQQECPTALLDASDSGTPLYRRFGFVDVSQTIQWRHTPASVSTPRHADSATHISLLTMQDMTELTAFDASFFGSGRAAIFSSLLLDYPERCLVTRNSDGCISGFLFAQLQTLGPWEAERLEDAEMLLAHALTLPFEDVPIVITPMENLAAAYLLQRYGFHQQRALTHMRRGVPPVLRKRERLYGQTSFALG